MKTILGILAFVVTNLFVYSQSVSIQGIVLDQETEQAVPFATIALHTTDENAPTAGTTTDLDGHFSITVQPGSNYRLVFSFMGYKPEEIILEAQSTSGELHLGHVYLLPLAIDLGEVEVEAMARTSANRLDRTSYRAEDFETAAGGHAIDVLSRLPGLSVSPDGEVSLRGTTDFIVYLNGRPTQMDADFLLAQIPASSITGIDVITVPSAAYDAQGKGGIINITTKQDHGQGLSVSVSTLLGGSPWGNKTEPISGDRLSDDRYGAGLSLMYADHNWMFYGGFQYDYRNLHGQRGGTARILDPLTNNYKIMDAGGLKPEWHENISANLGLDSKLSNNSSLSASYYYGSRLQGRTANYLYHIYMADKPDLNSNGTTWDESLVFNPNTGIRKGTFNNFNLDYSFRNETGSIFSASAMFEYSLLSHDIDNPNIFYDANAEELIQRQLHYQQFDETPLHAYRLHLDYQHPISETQTLSMGLQPQHLFISGDFRYDTLGVDSGDWGAFASLENASTLSRFVYAGYIDFSGQWDRLQYKLGLRAEHTDQSLEIDNPDYFNLFERPVQDQYLVQQTDLFPALHAAYTLPGNDVLSLAVNRRISRAPAKNMFPFLYRRHLEVYVVGDPALKPEYIQTYELAFKKNIGNQQLNLTAFHRAVDNAVFRVNTVAEDELVLIRSFTNAGKSTASGAELSANLEWGNRAKVFTTISVYHFHIDADIFGYRENNRSTNWNVKANGNYNLNRAFRVSADFDLRSAEVTAQGKNELFFIANAALTFSPEKHKSWRFQLRALNIFDSNNRVVATRAYNSEGVQIFYQDTDYYYYGPVAELSISYQLERSSRKKPDVSSSFGADEF